MKRVLLLLTLALFSLQPTFSQMEIVQDLNLGFNPSNPRGFIEYQGKTYFFANNSTGNESIYSIDSNGTVTEANTFNLSVKIVKLIVLNGEFYATVKSYISNVGVYTEPYLWRISFSGSDQILNGFCGNFQLLVYDSYVYNNELYFSGKSNCFSNDYKQLYAFNGSTFRLVEAENPTGDFDPQDFAIHNNELYFRGFTSGNGWELFKTNGASVSLAFEFLPGSSSSFPLRMTSYNGYLYLVLLNGTSSTQLFKLDTATSTATAFGIQVANDFKVFNNELYFAETNANNTVRQLAKLDANDIITFIPFANTSEDATGVLFYHELNGSLYFTASKPSTGYELYRYTPGSTAQLIEDYNPGSQGSSPFFRAALNGILYFGADNGNGLGNELHKYTPEVVIMTPIADANFEQLLINLGLDSGSIDGEVPTANIENITTLDISSMNVSSIAGIEGFTALQEFTSIQNPLTTLDFSSNTNLIKINVINNPITSVNVTQNTLLEELTVSTQTGTLNSINVSQNINLRALEVGANNLSTLNVTNNGQLTYLNFGLNPISNINLTFNPLLEFVGAYSSNLTDLDLSSNFNIQTVLCYDGQLTSLNLKNGNNNRNPEDVLVLSYIDATNNPSLSCIQVDDEVAALNNPNWFKDLTTSYSQNCLTLSVNENDLVDLISIYPNPSKDILNIKLHSNNNYVEATVYDIQGKRLITKAIDTEKGFIDISKIASGMYLLTLETKTTSTTKRFIKQ